MTLQHPSTIHPATMHISAGIPTAAGHHFLPSPALASPGSTGNSHPSNPPLAANAPCSTLFVANLGQFVSEHELKEVFSSMPGFSRLRMHTKAPHYPLSAAAGYSTASTAAAAAAAAAAGCNPVAFIEFKDSASASSAMNKLQEEQAWIQGRIS